MISPLKKEYRALVDGIHSFGFNFKESQTGRLPFVEFSELNLICSIGGHGKSQFALQTQHLINSFKKISRVICAGSGGALVDSVKPLDVVVGTKTIEHDFLEKFIASPQPEFLGCGKMIELFAKKSTIKPNFSVHFGPIACGDEDIVDSTRARVIQEKTQALIVAWEGAGGARATAFHGLPYLEIRVATDSANQN
ncbi:MAG: 5'-methylthioadenosine/S-adenosylhomocysteine nucleosidase, partial [Pseudomonadota bacterium]|nr:5'-methylthioadenosine/S-adenosylhomocysteine nucleosidase [Pseudomonadota bacterium]